MKQLEKKKTHKNYRRALVDRLVVSFSVVLVVLAPVKLNIFKNKNN